MPSSFLKRYLLALNRYKWSALASFLGVLGLSTVVAMRPPPEPQYKAAGALVQNFPVVALTATGTEVQQQGQGIISKDFLLADVLLQQVAQELGNRGASTDAETLRANTTIELIEDDQQQIQQVNVTYTGSDQGQVQTTLSLMFEGMVELSRVTNRARLRAIIAALDERLPDAEADLRAAEQALEAYDRQEGPAIQAALDGSLLGAISGGQQQQRQNQLALAGLESQIQSLERQLGMSPGEAFTAAALSADPIIAQLRSQILEAETQLSLLSPNLREAHPTIQELRQNLATYNTLLAARATEVIRGGSDTTLPSVSQVRQDSALDPARAALANQLVALSTERDALLSQQQVLNQADGQLRQQYSGLPNKQLERDRLAQQVARNQALYDQIQVKRIDAEAAEAETVSSLTVAQPPVTTLQAQDTLGPIAIVAVGSLLGVIVAGAVVFLLDRLDGIARTAQDLETILNDQDVPVLGLIPTLPTSASHGPPVLLQAGAPDLEAYERLRSNLRLANSRSEHSPVLRMVLITSTRDQEGKTTTAFNLAIAAARAGRRTLVVEVDLRSVSRSLWLGVTLPPAARDEPRRYYAGHREQPLHLVPGVENLYLAPSPGPQPQAAAILESSELEQFLVDARARFDLVILDAPSLSRSNDALVLARATDGLVLVTRPHYTEKAVVEVRLEQLLDTEELRLLGAIVNDADVPLPTFLEQPGAILSTRLDAPAMDVAHPPPLVRPIDF
ncbi:MAG: GumC family protein [Nodosilinea sp.]